MEVERFEQLDVWKRAHALVLDVHRLTSTLPSDQRFGLISQMQRSAVSVPANIAEGFKRRGHTDKIRFYNIAQGSLDELRYYFILCRDLSYRVDYNHMSAEAEEESRMLYGLIRSIERRHQAAR
jgi:four helix bundle protein